QVMMERDAVKRLTGRIEVDDAYLGGERNGGKRGRGSPGKTPIVAAGENTPEEKPIRLKLRRVAGFRRAEITALAKRNFNSASTVVSDRLRCLDFEVFRVELESALARPDRAKRRSAAFEKAVDFITARLGKHPNVSAYHGVLRRQN